MTNFTVATNIAAVTDTRIERYALGNVQVLTYSDTEVLLLAADGRIAAAVNAPGKAERMELCPGQLFKPSKYCDHVFVNRTDGGWSAQHSSEAYERLAREVDPSARFPSSIGEVFPDAAGRTVVLLNAEFLHRLASAIDTVCQVALFIPAPNTEGAIDGPIAVQGDSGIGCIMPILPKRNGDKSRLDKYTALRSAVVRATKTPKPMNKKAPA